MHRTEEVRDFLFASRLMAEIEFSLVEYVLYSADHRTDGSTNCCGHITEEMSILRKQMHRNCKQSFSYEYTQCLLKLPIFKTIHIFCIEVVITLTR